MSSVSRGLLLLVLLVFPEAAFAQARTADPIKRGLQLTDFPRFVKLADNVYGYEEIRQPGFTTVSLVVIGRDGVLIADGQGSIAATQTMLDRIKTLSPLPVRWYVVGSDHGDHTGGNAALPKDVTIIARAGLINDEQSIDVGGTTVKVLFLGRAHTGTDLSVHLPRERILFMSEAYLNRVFPAMRSAFPSEWVRVVDRALAMDVDRFVPGHGFIESAVVSREELVAFRDALVHVNTEVKRLHGLGLSAADAGAQANWGRYADWFLREQQAPIAVRKVYEEIEGKLPPVSVPVVPESIPPERLAARIAFQDARFGLFIHWGAYSQLGQGEWVMQNRKITVPEYEKLAATFNPVKFDAKAWVTLARAAGMKYITITSRHHDGFSMFATRANRYNIVDYTPFKRDVMKELAEECRKQGMPLFFYYSQLDWHHTDFFPLGRTGHDAGRPARGDWNRYLDFMDQQLSELLINYGEIGGIWFDGMWDKPDADWRLARTYAMIHRLQPAALVIPNHHKTPLPGEDVQAFEQDLPGANTQGYNTAQIGALPMETALTMNGAWGFNSTDRNFKSVPELIGYLVRAAGNGANLLLNIGPRPDGTIQPEAVERLEAMGRWLARYGSTIYGTRTGPIKPQPWGATTRRGDTVYVHVLKADTAIRIPTGGRRVVRAETFTDRTPVTFVVEGADIKLSVPARAAGEVDQVIVIALSNGARP